MTLRTCVLQLTICDLLQCATQMLYPTWGPPGWTSTQQRWTIQSPILPSPPNYAYFTCYLCEGAKANRSDIITPAISDHHCPRSATRHIAPQHTSSPAVWFAKRPINATDSQEQSLNLMLMEWNVCQERLRLEIFKALWIMFFWWSWENELLIHLRETEPRFHSTYMLQIIP